MKNIDKIKRLKKMRNIAIAFGTSAVFGLSGCGKKEDKPFEKTLEAIESSTCLDEVIYRNNNELLNNITKLEKCIKLSNKINKEKIETMYVSDETLKEKQLLESEEIEILLDEYKKDKSNEELLYEVNIQQRLLDNYIVSNG